MSIQKKRDHDLREVVSPGGAAEPILSCHHTDCDLRGRESEVKRKAEETDCPYDEGSSGVTIG